MADKLNTQTARQDIANNPFFGMGREELDQIINTIKSVPQQVGRTLGDMSDVFLARAGVTVPQRREGGLDNWMQKQLFEESLYRQRPKSAGEQIKQWAWDEYQKGNRSSEVLRIIGARPSETEALLRSIFDGGGENEEFVPQKAEGKRIRVQRLSDKQAGTILESDFDSKKYKRL